MQDQISATELAVNAWIKLKEVDPTNDLVKWMESDEISDQEFIKNFWDKSEDPNTLPGSMVSMRAETNYFLAVKKVLKEKHNIEI